MLKILIKMARRSETLNSPRQGAGFPLPNLSNNYYALALARISSTYPNEAPNCGLALTYVFVRIPALAVG